MLIRHIKTGEVREIEWAEWKVEYRSGVSHLGLAEWELVPDDPTAGVAAVVPGGDGPPPLEAQAPPHPDP